MTASVITIGTFDGVHLGHAALIAEARRRAAAHPGGPARVIAMSFDPHPMTRLNPALAPAMLTEFDRRAQLLRDLGADQVVRLQPTDELLGLTAREFIERVVREHAPIAIVEGPDFHFGKGRTGNVRALADMGPAMGFQTVVMDPVEVDLCDQTIVTASSTITRWLVAHGRVADAARVLGRPYELTGVVRKGNQMGRQLGFPTANLHTPCLLPLDGVYAGIAQLPHGPAFPAAVHVGTRSTFNDATRTVEAHILDWDGSLATDPAPAAAPRYDYDWPLRLALVAFLRDQARFESVAALVAQIRRDVQRVRDLAEPALAAPAR